jgi:hypothetical protein
MAEASWLIVTFGDSGSRKQNGHERGEGAETRADPRPISLLTAGSEPAKKSHTAAPRLSDFSRQEACHGEPSLPPRHGRG